jgi:hypothetical protein
MTQVILTQEEAARRRALNESRCKRKRKAPDLPQHVLDVLLPRIEVISYVDEEEIALGECWRWTGTAAQGRWPRERIDGRWHNVRRWVMQQLRQVPVPSGWVATVDCETSLCVNPLCCCVMNRSKANGIWKRLGLGATPATRMRAALVAGRSCSTLTPQRVQRLREDVAAERAAGRLLRDIYVDMGQRYNISPHSVRGIYNGKRWNPGNEAVAPQRIVSTVFDLGRLA